jgi:hypothetical protein
MVPGLAETCDRAVLSNAHEFPLYLAVSSEFVYWIVPGLCPISEDSTGSGKLFGARQSDGSAAMVIPDLPCPAELAVVGEDLYWTNNPGIPATRSIWTARIDGSGARLLIDDTYASHLHADSDNLYFIEDGRIRKVARDGCGPIADLAAIVGLTSETQEALAVDDRYVYWIDRSTFEDGSVNRVSKLGGEPETLATARQPVALTTSSDGLFWFDARPQQPINLYALSWEGTAPSLLASVDEHSHALAAVDGHVYWADGPWTETGNVYGLGLSGGDPVVLAQGEPTAIVLAADQKYLFWTTMESESIIDKGELVRICR